jgi:NagD protein
MEKDIEQIKSMNGFIIDMDGVIYHGYKLLPGAKEFVDWLRISNKKFMFLTNSSERTPEELQEKLKRMGIEVDADKFFTSALATAMFLVSQKPKGTAYIIGDAGLINALYNVGYTMNSVDPDYVVVGESRTYNYEKIEHAVNLVLKGAKLRALIAPIELATGRTAYFVGKPNPLMMRKGLKKLNCTREETVIIGDRMDTDVLAGIETEIDTCLVLSGITTREEMKSFAYQPKYVLNGVIDIIK